LQSQQSGYSLLGVFTRLLPYCLSHNPWNKENTGPKSMEDQRFSGEYAWGSAATHNA
jgi:hypothetical protein